MLAVAHTCRWGCMLAVADTCIGLQEKGGYMLAVAHPHTHMQVGVRACCSIHTCRWGCMLAL